MRTPDRGFETVLGIMSGTSLDGVDCVRVGFDTDGRPTRGRNWFRPFPGKLRSRLVACASGEATSWECGRLHHDLGRFYVGAVQAGLGEEPIEAIGMHGQTVFHRARGRQKATLQIGEPGYLAEAFRVPIVSNFRAGDMAAGGQGAPLATLFHVKVFGEPGLHVCIQNLGGIGNVTSIEWRGGGNPRVLAFDTGPGNLPIDDAVARLTDGRDRRDTDGRRAARGEAHEAVVRGWLRHSFLRRRPPKSAGREEFGAAFSDRAWDLLGRLEMADDDRVATLTRFTAESVAMNYRLHLHAAPDRVVLCGGGARNPVLSRMLDDALRRLNPRVEVVSCEARGWPPEAVEGGAFALLARERLLGRPGNLPETTGASRAVLCGQVTGV